MEHPNHVAKETTNGSQLNLDALYKIAPSCFTEARDEKGNVRRVVDFTKLRLLLGDNTVEDAPEVYDFTWVGKRAALQEAAAPIRKTLRPCKEESVDWDTTQNLYIEGDNLEVLKLLQNSYMGKVKMIYIDPPYNTGNDFVYHDDFAQSAEEYDENYIDGTGNCFFKNTEASSKGRIHSVWCSMMFSRLLIARSLLADDGAIFVSVDEHEHFNLLSIMNEVFGETNYIDSIVWDKKAAAKGVPPKNLMVNVHEYIVAFSKNNTFSFVGEKRDAEADGFKNPDNDPRGPWRTSNIKSTIKPIEEAFTITDPDTGKQYTNTWAFSKESLEKMIKEKRILWKESLPKQKEFLYEMTNENKAIKSNWGVFDAQSTTVYLKTLIPEVLFENPKPINLMKYLISVASKKDDLIMDFFSGSGTTAQAIFETNLEDGGKRHFVLVQTNEDTFAEDTEAYKMGIKNIADFGKIRVLKTGKKIKEESPLNTQELDTGFRVFKCEDSNYKEVVFAPKEYTQDMLAGLLDNIKEDRNDLDLLFDCMLRWGVELSLPLSTTKVEGCTIHNVNEGDLVGCFDGVVTEKVIDAIAALDPVRVVFRDSSFIEAANKMNLFELFKQKCSWTDEEVKKNVRVI